MNIFYEHQKGDLCRLHSLNAYFGYSKLNESDFNNYCNEYDNLIKGLNSQNMDGFAEGRSIVSYIIDKLENKYILLIPIKSYKKSREHLDIDRYKEFFKKKYISQFFEFNKNHIWFNKLIDNEYYKIDSISGVNKTDIRSINNGYLLILDNKLLYGEIEYYLKVLKQKILNNADCEVLIYNLFHSIKLLPLEKNENLEYNKKIDVFINLKRELLNYINYRRLENNNIDKLNEFIKNIKLFL